jgi:N6-L-threonylcarbamoyladenine synthase
VTTGRHPQQSQARAPAPRLILGIETSCDETAAAVVEGGRRVLSSAIASQIEDHRPFGGVVPEIAGRKHLENLVPVVQSALERSGTTPAELGAVAVTSSPGLMGALLVGTSFGKALAMGWDLPLIEVNHLHAHALAVFLGRARPRFPYLALVVSGGHTTLFRVDSPLALAILGQTRDDAAGEVLDKVAKFLGLGYPGGPAIDALAASGDPRAVRFPRGLGRSATLDFSFSGLKTAVVNRALGTRRIDGRLNNQQPPPLSESELRDLVASFQEAVVDTLVATTLRAARGHRLSTVVVSGGVAANTRLREKMAGEGHASGLRVLFPDRDLCTDNAAMIAGAAWHLARGRRFAGLDLRPSAKMKPDAC